jgi:hypothetical protein
MVAAVRRGIIWGLIIAPWVFVGLVAGELIMRGS